MHKSKNNYDFSDGVGMKFGTCPRGCCIVLAMMDHDRTQTLNMVLPALVLPHLIENLRDLGKYARELRAENGVEEPVEGNDFVLYEQDLSKRAKARPAANEPGADEPAGLDNDALRDVFQQSGLVGPTDDELEGLRKVARHMLQRAASLGEGKRAAKDEPAKAKPAASCRRRRRNVH